MNGKTTFKMKIMKFNIYYRSGEQCINNDYIVEPFAKQDSSQISLFAKAQGFIIREPHENKIKKGTKVPVLLISENI